MKISIVGAHGKVAMHLHPILKEKGHSVRGLIRKNEQKQDLIDAGAEPVLCDVEKEADISDAIGMVDAVVFAAGAGPGSGHERKWSVDYGGAMKLIDAAKKNGIERFVLISAMKVEEPKGSETFREYQKAKSEADEALRKSLLNYTIIRPGKLTNEKGSGRVSLAQELPGGEIPREDVARVVAAILEHPETIGMQLDLTSGDQPIEEAIKALTQKHRQSH